MQCCGTTDGTQPQFQPQADAIIDGLRGLSVPDLASRLKLGPKNAQRLFDEVYNYGDSHRATRAIDAYTGVVFRTLDVPSLTAESRQRLSQRVCITSSLYGTLRPDDLIHSYRLDFGMKVAPGDKTLSTYWRSILTPALIQQLRDSGETEVLNLLPLDASKCYDWKQLDGIATVYTATFQVCGDGGVLKTPNSDHLKRLRATLLRHILEADLTTAAQLRTLTHPDLMPNPDQTHPTTLQFITA